MSSPRQFLNAQKFPREDVIGFQLALKTG